MAETYPFFSQSPTWTSRQPPSLPAILGRAYAEGGFFAQSNRSVIRTVWILIGINGAVWGTWTYAQATRKTKLQRQLSENFTLSQQNYNAGRYWTILTSVFSHMELGHFTFNMFALHAFGSVMAWVPGVRGIHLLSLYIGSGIAGSAGWLYHRRSTQRSQVEQSKRAIWDYFGQEGRVKNTYQALGASGAVMGLGAAATCLAPFASMSLMFIPIPIPLWLITAGYFALDTYYLNSDTSRVGHAAHLGGAVSGFLFYFGYLRRFGGISRTIRRR